jgi:hypothetical protein
LLWALQQEAPQADWWRAAQLEPVLPVLAQ